MKTCRDEKNEEDIKIVGGESTKRRMTKRRKRRSRRRRSRKRK
jgi:hypothetical protein